MFKPGGSARARLVAAVVIAAVPVALALPIELVAGAGPNWYDRELSRSIIQDESRVEGVVLDEAYFEANPGPLTAERLAAIARQLRQAAPAVVAFNLDLSRGRSAELDEVLAALPVVSAAPGNIRIDGDHWRFDPAERGEATQEPPGEVGVGFVPRSNGLAAGLPTRQLIGAEVPLRFSGPDGPVPALAAAAVARFGEETGLGDPLARHGSTARYRVSWDDGRYISAGELSEKGDRLRGRIVLVGLESGVEPAMAGPFALQAPGDEVANSGIGANVSMAQTLLSPPFLVDNPAHTLGLTYAVGVAVALGLMIPSAGIAALAVFTVGFAWSALGLLPALDGGTLGHLKVEFPTGAFFLALGGGIAARHILRRRVAASPPSSPKLAPNGRAKAVAALSAIALAVVWAVFAHGVGMFEDLQENRSPALPPLDPDPRVQVVVFDDEYFRRNPGPLDMDDVVPVAEQIRQAGASVLAFNLRIEKNLGDPRLTAALDGVRVVDVAPGQVFPVGGNWSFQPTDPSEAAKKRRGVAETAVGLIPAERAADRSHVPLEFLSPAIGRTPALATAAVRQFADAEGLPDPLAAHGLERADQWPAPKTPLRFASNRGVIPAHELDERAPQLKGALVFVGLLTEERVLPAEEPFGGPHQVLRATFSQSGAIYGGVDFHAELAATLLQPPIENADSLDVLGSSLFLALAVGLATAFLANTAALAVSFSVLAAWWIGVVTPRFLDGGNIKFEVPLMAFLVAVIAGFAFRLFLARRETDRLSVLTEYVPPAVVMALTGPKRNRAPAGPVVATVLYTDVRGYTTLAGELDAARVKDALDVYYGVLGAVVSEHEGSLLYYAGDGMVVTFEAASPTAHAERAVACGAAMQGARSRMAYMLGQLDLPPLEFGVGIHTGEVIIGAVGSEHHRQFTALGEAVNIASRMCAVAEGGQVCLTEQTRQLLMAPPPLVDLGELQLKNVIRGIQGWRISEVLTVG